MRHLAFWLRRRWQFDCWPSSNTPFERMFASSWNSWNVKFAKLINENCVCREIVIDKIIGLITQNLKIDRMSSQFKTIFGHVWRIISRRLKKNHEILIKVMNIYMKSLLLLVCFGLEIWNNIPGSQFSKNAPFKLTDFRLVLCGGAQICYPKTHKICTSFSSRKSLIISMFLQVFVWKLNSVCWPQNKLSFQIELSQLLETIYKYTDKCMDLACFAL